MNHEIEFGVGISLLQAGANGLSYGFDRQGSGGIPPDPNENRVNLFEAEYKPTVVVVLLQKYNDVFLRTLSKATLENTQNFLVKMLMSDISGCFLLEEKLKDELSEYLVDPEEYHEEIKKLKTKYIALIKSEIESINKYSKILMRVMSALISRMIKDFRISSHSLFKLNNDNVQAIQRGLSFYQGLVSYLTDMSIMLSCNQLYMKETVLCVFITRSIAEYNSRYASLIEALPGTKEYEMFEDVDDEQDIKEKKSGKITRKKGK
ncbi:hypothetical protein CmeUKMEL1_02675 [Cryptosporidium meleagridis]|uniref:Uncharacterized protein n=1 Tax=Cryptosporidium meleagridis TaxID=93969 RepID=A0A2P4YXG5_9CRYT|nr:hypothetical protein CmeUKMEL1_02675 [Cryptosporidium meleagridis]